MTPPKDCKDLARRLRQAAQPLHGQTHHDLRLAAAFIDDIADGYPTESTLTLNHFRWSDTTLYRTDPEGER